MLIDGACHCGNLRYTLDWAPEPESIPARACTCTFCVKHGGVWTACAGGRLDVVVRDPQRVSRYVFGTRTADFHVCAVCGVVPLATSDIDGRLYAVVNVNTFEALDPGLLRHSSSDLDGETQAERLERRARNWIGTVRLRFADRDVVGAGEG